MQQPLHTDTGLSGQGGRSPQTHTDRRAFERWAPGEFTIAAVTSTNATWCGRVLNLSEGGAEILGTPPLTQTVGGELTVEIIMDNLSVSRHGRLLSVRPGRLRVSHAIVFDDHFPGPLDDSSLCADVDVRCVCCRAIVALSEEEASDDYAVCMCADCDDLARERVGRDYEYEDLGWVD